jgi:hypothetical protein
VAEEVTEGKSRTASLPLFSSLIYLLVLCCPLFTNAFTQGDPPSSPSSSLLLRERSSLLAGCETTASCGRFALRPSAQGWVMGTSSATGLAEV